MNSWSPITPSERGDGNLSCTSHSSNERSRGASAPTRRTVNSLVRRSTVSRKPGDTLSCCRHRNEFAAFRQARLVGLAHPDKNQQRGREGARDIGRGLPAFQAAGKIDDLGSACRLAGRPECASTAPMAARPARPRRTMPSADLPSSARAPRRRHRSRSGARPAPVHWRPACQARIRRPGSRGPLPLSYRASHDPRHSRISIRLRRSQVLIVFTGLSNFAASCSRLAPL